jgi:hypothetical protein
MGKRPDWTGPANTTSVTSDCPTSTDSHTHEGVPGSDSRFNTVNNAAMTSQRTARSKEKCPPANGSTTTSKRRNVASATGCDNDAENRPILPQQAVPSVGPQGLVLDMASTAPQHPSLTWTMRTSQHLSSILNNSQKPDSCSSNATDVWYFMQVLCVPDKPATLPEHDDISKK